MLYFTFKSLLLKSPLNNKFDDTSVFFKPQYSDFTTYSSVVVTGGWPIKIKQNLSVRKFWTLHDIQCYRKIKLNENSRDTTKIYGITFVLPAMVNNNISALWTYCTPCLAWKKKTLASCMIKTVTGKWIDTIIWLSRIWTNERMNEKEKKL